MVLHGVKSEGSYSFKKSGSIDVDGAAPLRDQRGSVLTLVFTEDFTVHKHRDQGALGESPYIGLRRRNTSHINILNSYLVLLCCPWLGSFSSALGFAFVLPTMRQLSGRRGNMFCNDPITARSWFVFEMSKCLNRAEIYSTSPLYRVRVHLTVYVNAYQCLCICDRRQLLHGLLPTAYRMTVCSGKIHPGFTCQYWLSGWAGVSGCAKIIISVCK